MSIRLDSIKFYIFNIFIQMRNGWMRIFWKKGMIEWKSNTVALKQSLVNTPQKKSLCTQCGREIELQLKCQMHEPEPCSKTQLSFIVKVCPLSFECHCTVLMYVCVVAFRCQPILSNACMFHCKIRTFGLINEILVFVVFLT